MRHALHWWMFGVYPGYLLVNGRTTLKRKKTQGQNSHFTTLSGSQPDRHWSGRECARLPADHAKCLPLSDMPAPSTRRLGCKDGSMHVRHVGGDGPSFERFASAVLVGLAGETPLLCWSACWLQWGQGCRLPSFERSALKYTCLQPARTPNGWPDLKTSFRQHSSSGTDVSVWKQRRGTCALRICKAEACPDHEPNVTNENDSVFWPIRRSIAPMDQYCQR